MLVYRTMAKCRSIKDLKQELQKNTWQEIHDIKFMCDRYNYVDTVLPITFKTVNLINSGPKDGWFHQ